MNHEDGIPLMEWFNEHQPATDLLWRNGAIDQFIFVRDRLPPLFGLLYKSLDDPPYVRVVGAHHSKSVELPVYSIKVPEVEVRMRNNFYNWVVSVKAEQHVPDIFGHILSKDNRTGPVQLIYAEGFTEDWIFKPWHARAMGPCKFSLTLSRSDYQLFTFLYLLTEALGLHGEWGT